MKRTVIWSAVAIIAAVTLATVWFLDNFEEVETTRWEREQKEARRNPFLALERLLQELGRPVVRVRSPAALDAIPGGGVVILDANRRRNVSQARAERVLDWVANGGYLVVAAEQAGDDPVLARLGITRYRPSALQCRPNEAGRDKTTQATAAAPENAEFVEFAIPGRATVFRLRQTGGGLTRGAIDPAWHVGPSEENSRLLHYGWGKGQITVVAGLTPFRNYDLGNHDHAELLWALLDRYQPRGEIRLASRMEVPTLWQWLVESAWTATVSTAVLIALWLWYVVPRFGSTLPEHATERRGLIEHLSAIGRSVWREGGIEYWLATVRQSVRKRITLRHPYLNRLLIAPQCEALASLTSQPAKAIRAAMTAGQAGTPDEFTQAMQTLQRLDQRL